MPVVSAHPGRVVALLVASAAVLLTAACGGGGGGSTATPDNGGGGGNGFAAYAQCLKNNGVTLTVPSGRPTARPSGQPRPQRSGGGRFGGGGRAFGKPAGVDAATWQKAQTACASVRPSFGPGRRGGGGARNSAYRNCLRDHGVTTGKPPASADPARRKAIQACAVLRPSTAPSPAG